MSFSTPTFQEQSQTVITTMPLTKLWDSQNVEILVLNSIQTQLLQVDGQNTEHIWSIQTEREIQTQKNVYDQKVPKDPPKKPRPMQVHIATGLDGTTIFCCPECSAVYLKTELLEQHLQSHKIEKTFICDICGLGLKRKALLRRHKMEHNTDRRFVCPLCMKGFKRQEHLDLHSGIHSEKKTRICVECGKGFHRKDHLKKHAKSHVIRKKREQMKRNQYIIEKEATTQVVMQVSSFQMQIPVQI